MIPKCPNVPPLTTTQIKQLTKIIFLEEKLICPVTKQSDLLFVFGGRHPGCWQTAFQAYQDGIADKILLTGGIKPTSIRHPDWNNGHTPESHVMKVKLLELGVSDNALIVEDRSTDSLENVLFAKKLFDFKSIQCLVFICKSFAAGRQYRTLRKHLPESIELLALPFVTSPTGNSTITRHNWMDHAEGRSFVYGEYMRILVYGEQGDIIPLEKPIQGLSKYDFKTSIFLDSDSM